MMIAGCARARELDKVTSALDNRTKTRVQRALNAVMEIRA
jgi:ABC-type multidrug transport system fused ATPase/permease subunit